MPEVIHASYNKKGNTFKPAIVYGEPEDIFILENLLESGYENYDGANSLNESHMMAVLECLSQLHGTGMAYKLYSVSDENAKEKDDVNEHKSDIDRERMVKLKKEFPGLEEQIQLTGSYQLNISTA